MNTQAQSRGVPIFEENPFVPESMDNPFPLYERMRDLGPIVWLQSHGCYAVCRHDEVHAVANDWQRFSSAAGTGLANYRKDKPWRAPSIVLEADPPVHTRGRTVFSRALSPGMVRKTRERFEKEAEILVDRALDTREIDGVGDLAQAYILKSFPDAVGLPSADRHKLLEYGDMQLHSFVPPTWLDHDPYANIVEMSEWVSANCRREALTPDGFGAAIYAGVDSGDITEAEAQNLVRSFLSAGLDNSITSFGNAFWCFATFPEQWDKLRAEPSLMRGAYEEALRYLGPLQANFRTTTGEIEFAGARLTENEKVAVFLASANRDPRHWPDADTFDITRRAAGHIAFGVGVHGCVGQVLARLEAEALFSVLVRKVKAMEVIGPPKRRYISVAQSFESLPMRLTPV